MYTCIFLVIRDTVLQKHIFEPQRWPTCELKIIPTAFENKINIVGSFGTFIFNFIPTGGFKTFYFIFLSSFYPTSSQIFPENQKIK